MESDLPLHLLATFHQSCSSDAPQWIIRAEAYNVWAAAAPDDSPEFTLVSADQNAKTTFSFQSAKRKQTILKRPLPRWARYGAGVILELYGTESALSQAQTPDLQLPKGLCVAVMNLESGGPRYDYGLGWIIATLWYHILQRPVKTDAIREVVDRVHREYMD